MKGFLLFLLGLVIGVGGAWAYYATIAAPRLITDTEVAVKEQFEQSQVEEQMFVVATITAITDTTIEATTEKDDQERAIVIQVDTDTKLYAQANDDSSTKTPISLSDLAPGSSITVVASGIIDLTQPINAAEIIKL